jgi:hypothetical protein
MITSFQYRLFKKSSAVKSGAQARLYDPHICIFSAIRASITFTCARATGEISGPIPFWHAARRRFHLATQTAKQRRIRLGGFLRYFFSLARQ